MQRILTAVTVDRAVEVDPPFYLIRVIKDGRQEKIVVFESCVIFSGKIKKLGQLIWFRNAI